MKSPLKRSLNDDEDDKKHEKNKRQKLNNEMTFLQLEETIKQWTFIARVTSKSIIKTYNKGECFNFDMLDESGEIRCVVFSPNVSKFYETIKVGSMYMLDNIYISVANKMFNNLNNKFEIILQNDSNISLYENDDKNIPLNKYDFISMVDLDKHHANEIVDIIGKVKTIDDISEVTLKDGHVLQKREVLIVDDENQSTLVFWGSNALNIKFSVNDVLVLKKVKITEFRGIKKLSVQASSLVEINVSIPETKRFIQDYNEV